MRKLPLQMLLLFLVVLLRSRWLLGRWVCWRLLLLLLRWRHVDLLLCLSFAWFLLLLLLLVVVVVVLLLLLLLWRGRRCV